jgi:hypothetical protein
MRREQDPNSWMYRLSPAARDLFLRDPASVELLRQIGDARRNLTWAIAMQSLTPQ